MNKKGFTLIEMLIVIFMVAVLSTVALPQYRKAINKSKAAEGITMARSVIEGVAMYALTFKKCPTELSELDVKVNPNGRYWSLGLTYVGPVEERNCGFKMWTVDQNPSFAVQQIMVYTPSSSGIPSGLNRGDIYWECGAGECDDFFKILRVKEPTEGAGYYM